MLKTKNDLILWWKITAFCDRKRSAPLRVNKDNWNNQKLAEAKLWQSLQYVAGW